MPELPSGTVTFLFTDLGGQLIGSEGALERCGGRRLLRRPSVHLLLLCVGESIHPKAEIEGK